MHVALRWGLEELRGPTTPADDACDCSSSLVAELLRKAQGHLRQRRIGGLRQNADDKDAAKRKHR